MAENGGVDFVVDDIIDKRNEGRERSETLFYLIVKGGNVEAIKAVCIFLYFLLWWNYYYIFLEIIIYYKLFSPNKCIYCLIYRFFRT